jgi:uncharacterized alkaline shock family protein YloU
VGDVTLHVTDTAVASMAAAAARAVPGVAVLSAELAPDPEPFVRVAIMIQTGDNCRDIAAAVQRSVTQTLAEQWGRTATVEVTVAEVALP